MRYGFRADLLTADIDPAIFEELGMSGAQLTEIEAVLPQVYEDVEATFR